MQFGFMKDKGITDVIFIVRQKQIRLSIRPLVFVSVMEALSREFRVALPWELL